MEKVIDREIHIECISEEVHDMMSIINYNKHLIKDAELSIYEFEQLCINEYLTTHNYKNRLYVCMIYTETLMHYKG